MHKHGQKIRTGYRDSLGDPEANEQPALEKFAGSLVGMAGGTIRGTDQQREAQANGGKLFSTMKSELVDCRRRLAPHVALQNDTDRAALNLAAVARVTGRVIDIVEQLVLELEKSSASKAKT